MIREDMIVYDAGPGILQSLLGREKNSSVEMQQRLDISNLPSIGSFFSEALLCIGSAFRIHMYVSVYMIVYIYIYIHWYPAKTHCESYFIGIYSNLCICWDLFLIYYIDVLFVVCFFTCIV